MVDGVRTIDPKNPVIKQGVNSLDNMVFVPGEAAAFEDQQGVPHGEIRKVWYQSSTLGEARRLHIYFPPGYESGKGRYPVFYLLHGGGDEDSGWSTIGRAGFVLDNLLAAKKAKPMIVVMPNGSLPRPASLPPATPGAPPDPAVTAALQERFTSELLKDIVPFVEKNYRVLPGSANRALAGLSMGGGQTLRASSAPEYAGDPARTNPEEALVAAVSSCHMLWFLSLAAKRGYVVDSYTDEAEGVMEKNAAGKIAVTKVTLRPLAVFSGAKLPDRAALDALHHAAHGECFIANSIRSEVVCEPRVA